MLGPKAGGRTKKPFWDTFGQHIISGVAVCGMLGSWIASAEVSLDQAQFPIHLASHTQLTVSRHHDSERVKLWIGGGSHLVRFCPQLQFCFDDIVRFMGGQIVQGLTTHYDKPFMICLITRLALSN